MTRLVTERMENYTDLLYSGRAFLTNSVEVTQDEWDMFYREQSAFSRYKGVSSISFIERFKASEKPAFEQKMRAKREFGGAAYAIKPAGNRTEYAAASLASSVNDISGGVGTDMLSTADRKAALDAATKLGTPQATQPMTLATGSQGFSVALRTKLADGTQGYVLEAFRTNELMESLISHEEESVAFKIVDVTDKQPIILLQSRDWNEGADLKQSVKMQMAGRMWEITYASDPNYDYELAHAVVPMAIIFNGITFSALLLLAFHVFLRTHEE